MELTELLSRIKTEKGIIFYGAQVVASSIYTALRKICNPHVECFVVTSRVQNPVQIDGIDVIEVGQIAEVLSDTLILVATPIVHHAAICDILKERNLNNYICIDSKLENSIMMQYYSMIHRFPLIEDRMGKSIIERDKSICLYMVKSPFDTKLSTDYKLPEWYVSILAGAVYADQQKAEVYDNTGDNISIKNRNYCELTATYWVWKNACFDYVGICHYRRIFELGQAELDYIFSNEMDVILPIPTVSYPNAEEHHKRYISDEDWNAFKTALKELAPEYEEQFYQVFGDIYFYNFNIMVAKKEVFDRFCEWMFPILERVEQICEEIDPNRRNRYMGYISESLVTLYFMLNKDGLSIEHAKNIMLL